MDFYEVKYNFWIARWLKKPSSYEIVNAEKDILAHNRVIILGISKVISERIINEYKKNKIKCLMYGNSIGDYDAISSKLQLPRDIITLVLERKKIIGDPR